MFGKDELSKTINQFLENHDLDVMYTMTILAILFALSYYKELKNWDKIEDWRKGIVGSTIFGAVVFSLISLLRLFGIIDL